MQRARIWQYEITTSFHETSKTVNEVQNESWNCVIEHVRKRVVTGDGTDSNVDAADSDATVAGLAAIQLMVAKLRLGERKQPAIGICEIIVDKNAFSNRLVGVLLLQ
jgi:hypothetical protein